MEGSRLVLLLRYVVTKKPRAFSCAQNCSHEVFCGQRVLGANATEVFTFS